MAAVQAEDVHARSTTNRRGVAAFDFVTVSGCDQLVVSPTHACGGTLDLLMTDVPDLVRVAIVTHIGNLDHSFLSVGLFDGKGCSKLVC